MSVKKDKNKRGLIRELYFSRMLSCADLCDKMDKSLPLITKLVNELIEEDKIVESGLAASTGGRRPVMYSIREDVNYIVAVSMDQLIIPRLVHNTHIKVSHQAEMIGAAALVMENIERLRPTK